MSIVDEQLQYPPDINYEFPGISDVAGLQLEIARMRDQLGIANSQLLLERQLARDIHNARHKAIMTSPALQLVYEVGETKHAEASAETSARPTVDDMLSSAFLTQITSKRLPEGAARAIARDLRATVHPDTGGSAQLAQELGEGLNDIQRDEALSVASALLTVANEPTTDAADLRKERYRLALALDAAKPHFESEETAREYADREISGAEWRVRVTATFKAFDLIIGDTDTWNSYLQSIGRQQHAYLIEQANQFQPAILAVRERLAIGDPLTKEAVDIDAVDAVLESIWSTLGEKHRNSRVPYSPPYQNWLPILLPAMQLLDPGEKPGETYTHFEPPFKIVRAAETVHRSPEKSLTSKKIGQSLFNQLLDD